MVKGYRPVVRDQGFLLPPSMIDWLPDDHLVWFVLDVVAELDTSRLHARAARRRDGQPARGPAGRAAYDPDMLLALLIYGYAGGERSSRRIERLCLTDVAFRVICAGDAPDHTVLARFRQVHAEAFADLFAQVLRLCRAAGLVSLATVAIDGTKIAANASKQANHGCEWLDAEAGKTDRTTAEQAEADKADRQTAQRAGAAERTDETERETVERILTQAGEVDAAENEVFGPACGDELPPGWNGRAGRRARIAAALARIHAAADAKQEQEQAAAVDRAHRDAAALAAAQAALAAERDRQQARIDAWEQAWEHAAATPGAPVPKGRAPVEESSTVRRAEQRLARAHERLTHPDTAPRRGRKPTARPPGEPDTTPPRANITDPDSTIMPTKDGWVQGYNVQFAITTDQIILATGISTNPADIVSYTPMVNAAQQAAAQLGDPAGIGTLLFDTGYASNDTLTAPGPDRLIALTKSRSVQAAARDQPTTGPPPPDATPRQAMDHRLRTPQGAALYKRRGATVEPGIGNFKKLLNQFSRRGLPAVISETHLAATAFNLLKIHRTTPN